MTMDPYQSNQLNQLGLPNEYDDEDGTGLMVMGDPRVQHAPITETIEEAAERNRLMQRQRDIWGDHVPAPSPPSPRQQQQHIHPQEQRNFTTAPEYEYTDNDHDNYLTEDDIYYTDPDEESLIYLGSNKQGNGLCFRFLYHCVSKCNGLGGCLLIISLIAVMLLLEVMYTEDEYGLENGRNSNNTRTHTNSSGYVDLGLVGFIPSPSPVANTAPEALDAYADTLLNDVQDLNDVEVKITGVPTLVPTLVPTVSPTMTAVTISHGEETHVDVNLSPSASSPAAAGDPINELEDDDVDIPSTTVVNDPEDDDFTAVNLPPPTQNPIRQQQQRPQTDGFPIVSPQFESEASRQAQMTQLLEELMIANDITPRSAFTVIHDTDTITGTEDYYYYDDPYYENSTDDAIQPCQNAFDTDFVGNRHSPQTLAIETMVRYLSTTTILQGTGTDIDNPNSSLQIRMRQQYCLLVLWYSTTVTRTTHCYDLLTAGDGDAAAAAQPGGKGNAGVWDQTDGWRHLLIPTNHNNVPNNMSMATPPMSEHEFWFCGNLVNEPSSLYWGVSCDENGFVNNLVLKNNGMMGRLPDELMALDRLEILNLSENDLTGTIPTALHKLSALVEFEGNGNRLTGPIPASVAQLTHLNILYLDENDLTGTIPSEIGGMTNLEALGLYKNQLTGQIPGQLSQLSLLKTFYLDSNNLSGTFPDEFFAHFTQMRDFRIRSNILSGNIPPSIHLMTELQVLYLDNCELTGSISPEIGDLTNLNELHLHQNRLTGTLPTQLGLLTNMQILYLDNNQLRRQIPTEIGQLTQLKDLLLHRNEFSGSIPVEFGSLRRLAELQMNANRLKGTIPEELGFLFGLRVLRLDDNKLSGTVPDALGGITTMNVLRLFGNRLTGTVPDSVCDLVSSQDEEETLTELMVDCSLSCNCCTSCV